MNLEEDIVQKDLSDLLLHFSKQTYSASSSDEKVCCGFIASTTLTTGNSLTIVVSLILLRLLEY